MEMNSPPPCANTVTIRRNPHRKARATPSSKVPLPMPLSPSSISQHIPSFPIQDILSVELPPNPNSDLSTSETPPVSENLKVFLRIRPLPPTGAQIIKPRTKNAWPQNPTTKNASRAKSKKKKSEICISVNDSHSVTVCPPAALLEAKRVKSEVYEGFSHVFSSDSSQDEVFAKMVNPLVDDFLRGKCGMLAALGPSGSGKTHTVFGTPREPGMVPLTLRRIFSTTEDCQIPLSRTFYLSMFEICSEKGKAERILDLFQDVGDLCMHQSSVKGLQEVTISDVQQAESLIARGLLKRATARTNSNSQSSRSQCIINIRSSPIKNDEEVDVQSNGAILTVVDLAGAEREKRTGNQGARLLESNFINNTSMVFGLCLRSLLEHQKNPKKPFQKHFQSSLLTRYLRDYLEGKRRMALILTVKSGEEDYLDTTFLLRQASPYMKIKFNNAEEPVNSLCTKRHFQTLPRIERLKRMKLGSIEACETNGGNGAGDEYRLLKEAASETETLPQEIREIDSQNSSVPPATTIHLEVNDGTALEEGSTKLEKEREKKIMQNFAKALWNVLKEYKEKLEVAENQIHSLSESLANEKMRSFELDTQLKDLKSNFFCLKEVSPDDRDESSANSSVEQEGCQPTDVSELNAGVSSLRLDESECMVNEKRSDTNDEPKNIANDERSDTNVNNVDVLISSPLAVEDLEEHGYQVTDQECEDFPRNFDSADDPKVEGVDDVQFNRDASDSGPPEDVVSSPKSLVAILNDSGYSVEGNHSNNEENKKRLDRSIMPEEDAELASRCSVTSAHKSEPKLDSCSKALTAEKPKRRLLPASSILLKNISSLGFEDENEKPKGARGEKKLVPDERNRTQGSISLLRLLRNNLHLQ